MCARWPRRQTSFCTSAKTVHGSPRGNLTDPSHSLMRNRLPISHQDAGNKGPSRCHDVNDNSASACLLGHMGCASTLRVGTGSGRAERDFINHFSTPHQGYVVGSLWSANCLCIDNAKELRRDLSSSAAIYGREIRMTFSQTVIIAPLI